jgi:hypothetical protein
LAAAGFDAGQPAVVVSAGVSFFTPQELLILARDAGFKDAKRVSAAMLTQRYFAGRTDGLRTSSGEELLVAAT